jgi:hypothetical protein
VTAWGVAPARGRLRLCGHCGATLTFVELGRAGAAPEAQARLYAAIRLHLRTYAECCDASTFSSKVITACRCNRPMRLAREDGLLCARCEGLISPDVAQTTAAPALPGGQPGGTP